MVHEQKPASADGASADGIRGRFWFQALAAVAIVAVLALIAVRYVHHDVVQNWKLLATCVADAGTQPSTVSTTLDTSDCATTPNQTVSGRGWPIVPFVLPAAAGIDPHITKVLSDATTRTMRVEYASEGLSPSGAGVVLAFIEVAPGDIPGTPYVIDGASGPVTIATASTG